MEGDAGIPVVFLTRERAQAYFERPELLSEMLEPGLALYKERETALEVTRA